MIQRIVFALIVPLLVLLPAVYSQASNCTTPSGRPGLCGSILSCPSLSAVLKENSNDSTKANILRKSICKIINDVILVCCPSEDQPTVPLTSPPIKCGRRILQDCIVPGVNSSVAAWPWATLLETTSADGKTSVVCGGVLISERHVLTAAHCVEPYSGSTGLSVRIGEHFTEDHIDCEGGVCYPPEQRIRVEKLIIHENYGSPPSCAACNDIALLHLAHDVKLEINVQPICLTDDIQRDLAISLNRLPHGYFIGWGTNDATRAEPLNVLRQIKVSFSNNSTFCSLYFEDYPDPNMVFCSVLADEDMCLGDSGGPLMLPDIRGIHFYSVGILSRGPRSCGSPDTPRLFTNVAYYVPWIISNL